MMIRAPQNGTPETDLDLAEIGQSLVFLMAEGQTFELRALPSGKSWVGDSTDGAVKAARFMGGGNLYYTLNPCRPGMEGAAKNSDILARRWYFVDVDPIRPTPDVMATEGEKAAAHELTQVIRAGLKALGWPDPLVIDSGNGYHLLYRVDLPNDRLSAGLVSASLKALAAAYDTDAAHVDPAVHNAGRIARLPGTWTRKGVATEDRPHRMARLVSIPRALELVTPDQIKALVAEVRDEPTDRPGGGIKSPKAKAGDPIAAWFRKAMESECAKAITAAAGTRHNALRAAARTLAGYIHHGYLARAQIRDALILAGRRAELPDDEAREVIDWGMGDGADNPLPWPEKLDRPKSKPADPNGQANGETNATPERLTIRASEVTPRPVRWLWQDRIAIDFISLFAGRTGLGKSFILCDLAARLTNGHDLPDGPSGLGGECPSVLFISEDPYEYVLAPRLLELGADMDLVHFLRWEVMAEYTLADISFLERAWIEAGKPVLIVIDPPTNFMGGVDEHKNAEVRAVLTELVGWINGKGIAIALITHVNKQVGKGVDAVNRILGSVAWASTSRVALAFAPDPNDPSRCLFAGSKNNLGQVAKALGYRIKRTDTLAVVEWLGEVDITADEAMAGERRAPRKKDAKDWLIDLFNQKREWPSPEFWASAKEHAITKYAIDEAKAELDVPRARRVVGTGGDITYTWWVPVDWPYLTQNDEEES